jgi:glutaredoxin-like protein
MTSSSSVRLLFFETSIGCETCGPTRRALEQAVEADDSLSLETLNLVLDKERAALLGVERVPAVVLSAPDCERIRYYGPPLGNELPTLLAAARMAGTGRTNLSDHTRSQLRTLTRPVALQVFFTPTCVYCPQMIALANQLAIESPLVSSTAIDATEYPDLVRRFHVNGVPKTVINGSAELLGAVTEEELVRAVIQ